MSAWVEVFLKGDHRAVIAADSVVGVICAKGSDTDAIATPEAPLTLVLRGGETMPPVYGISAADLLVRLAGAKIIQRSTARPATVAYADRMDQFWNALEAAVEGPF